MSVHLICCCTLFKKIKFNKIVFPVNKPMCAFKHNSDRNEHLRQINYHDISFEGIKIGSKNIKKNYTANKQTNERLNGKKAHEYKKKYVC